MEALVCSRAYKMREGAASNPSCTFSSSSSSSSSFSQIQAALHFTRSPFGCAHNRHPRPLPSQMQSLRGSCSHTLFSSFSFTTFSYQKTRRNPSLFAASLNNAGNSNEQNVNLVHVKDAAASAGQLAAALSLPNPLFISDLSPPPLHGSSLRVAYQGVSGAYSEAAAGKAYPNCEPVPCDQFEATFQAVELWLADRAVLPLENSLGGSIHRNYDLLLRHGLHIVGEVQLPVHHCLLAMPGVSKTDLVRVISHPQALAQCENTLTRLGLDVAREGVDDTAGAAQFIAENNIRDTAAIASSRAAEIYNMNILAEGIQDDSGNVTRFAMLAREPIIPRVDRPFKTSIVFANDDATGTLFKILAAFAFRDINLTKIESRPQRKKPLRIENDSIHGKAKHFEYLFYIDFEASMADPRAQKALFELQEFTSFLRILGSYPMDMTPLVRSPPL